MEKFSIKKRFKKITVACHDAGGSEIVASWLNKNKIKFFPFLGGPAKKIFKRRFKKLNIKKLDYALSHSDFVITGTSLKSNLELNVIKKAKKKNLITKSFIDHWVNYKKRFTRKNKKIILPHKIIIGDIHAKRMAEKIFTKKRVEFIKNPLWEEIKGVKQLKKKSSNINILFTSSYFNKRDRINPEINFTGPELFERLLKKIYFLLPNKKIKSIVIRHHPRESKNKYLKFIDKKKYVSLDKNIDLLKSIKSSTHVIGCESMAMVHAKLLGKKTFNIDIGIPRLRTIPKKYFNKLIKVL